MSGIHWVLKRKIGSSLEKYLAISIDGFFFITAITSQKASRKVHMQPERSWSMRALRCLTQSKRNTVGTIQRENHCISSMVQPMQRSLVQHGVGVRGRQFDARRGMSRNASWPLDKILNLLKYPIHDVEDIRRQQLIEKCRVDLQQSGYCYLPHFVHEDALSVLFESCIQHEGICHTAASVRTVWNQPISRANSEQANAKDDPSNLKQKYSKCQRGMVAMDELSPSGPLRSLYASDEMRDFLSELRGEGDKPLCRLEDDLASCSVNIYSQGNSECWAFNRHALTAAVVVQESNLGGRMQVLKNVWEPLQRNDTLVSSVIHTLLCASDVEHVGLSIGHQWPLAEILKSMDENEQPTYFFKGPLAVRNIVARSGGLLITVEKQSVFRVAPVHGDEAFIMGVLKYEDEPGYRYHKEALVELFGRSKIGEERKETVALEGGEHRVFGYDEHGKLVEMDSPPDLDLSTLGEFSDLKEGSPEAADHYKEAKAELEKDLGMQIEDDTELTEEEVMATLGKKEEK